MPRPKGAQEYKTARIWAVTLSKVKLIAVLTDTSMVQVLDRLANAELAALRQKNDERVAELDRAQGIRKALEAIG